MQFDNTEMAAVAATQADTLPGAARLDLYGPIHKALRAALFDAVTLAGRTDADDPSDWAHLHTRVEALLHFCAQHIVHENGFVHPAVEAATPGGSAHVAAEHQAHGQAIAALSASLQALAQLPTGQRAPAMQAFYLQLADFVADNLVHMAVEETEHNRLLWSRYTDAELMEVHNALVASIPPSEMADTLQWMLPALHHGERCALLADMQAHAPAPVFEGVCAMARQALSGRDWARLAQALAVPA